MVHTLEMNVEIPEALLSDMMITAFDGDYGSCWRWCEPHGDNWFEGEKDEWRSVLVHETVGGDDPPKIHKVDWGVLQRGMQTIIHNDRNHSIIGRITEAVFDDDAGVLDSNDLDTIVQYGLFGKGQFS